VFIPIWFVLVFIFVFGCCVGSFLNVVVYRLPKDKSLVKPPSACPVCGVHINFYDNIPLVSWLLLGCKCRYCKTKISPRYFFIEFLTGAIFAGLFVLYFISDLRYFEIDGTTGLTAFTKGGWFIYLLHIILLSALVACSAIDLELFVIPISICWFATVIGLIASGFGVFIIRTSDTPDCFLLPAASPATASLALGAAVGLVISLVLLITGLIKPSYETSEHPELLDEPQEENSEENNQQQTEVTEHFNDRFEMFRELLFLSPIIICSAAFFLVATKVSVISKLWSDFSQYTVVSGFLGSLWGYFVGCAVVWAVRIIGTFSFGKEAMGLGDVHLMGAVGAVLGPVFVVVAFFIAPFFGIVWALVQLFFKKNHKIPYGPFLSLGVFAVMILHDWILRNLAFILYGR
jgi:leader peptidase (prepilin peptidase)/N-methyltransferase